MKQDKLKQLLSKHNFDALLISSIPNIIYLTGFSGFSKEDRDAYLLITKDKQYVFTHGIYKEAAEKYIQDFELVQISRENPFKSVLRELIQKKDLKAIGFEGTNVTFFEYTNLSKEIGENILKDASKVLYQIRVIKTQEEIDAIYMSCDLGDKAFMYIQEKIKTGITEKELALELEMFIKKHGAELSFPTIVAFGANASLPHHQTSSKPLEKNNFVLMDFGIKINNYCSDMTRTVFFGKATEEQKKMYNTVLESQKLAIEQLNNKTMKQFAEGTVNASELDKISREYITSKGYPNIPHSLGHGIGIEVHESPRLTPISDEILREGMVFSIEPGIYLPGIGGVRIEDLFAIEQGKLVQLTKSPRNFTEIN